MTEEYVGKDYTVELRSSPCRKMYVFSLVAIHRQSKRWSCINTLNTVLSWFGIEGDSALVSEPDWLITKRRLDEYRKLAKEIFGNKKYLTSLESKLDEDRSCGEWANVIDTQKQIPM